MEAWICRTWIAGTSGTRVSKLATTSSIAFSYGPSRNRSQISLSEEIRRSEPRAVATGSRHSSRLNLSVWTRSLPLAVLTMATNVERLSAD